MRKLLCLSILDSLRMWLQSMKLKSGINFEYFRKQFQKCSTKENLVSIVLNKVAIKQCITYNSQNNSFSGLKISGEIKYLT